MATSLNGNNIQYPDNTQQFTKSPLVKTRYTSSPNTNLSLPTWSSETDASQVIDMGIPQNGTNWYRCEYYSVRDDSGGNNGGWGMACYRWTPSSGWLRAQAQGQHSEYDNNCSDFYASGNGLWYIPVHPSYPNEQHQFKFMGTRHPDDPIRIHCDIGQDNRICGWQNNMFSVTEIDTENTTNVNLTTY